MPKSIIKAIPLISISATTFTGSYVPINPLGLAEACNIVLISNLTNQLVTLSLDGITDHAIQAAGNIKFLQLETNSIGGIGLMAKGQVFYAKANVGTGIIYVEGYYQPNG